MAYESTLIVGDNRIVIDKPMRDFMAVCARFCEDTVMQSRNLEEKFNEKIKSFQDLFPEGFDRYMHSLSMLCEVYTLPWILEAFLGNEVENAGKEIFTACVKNNILPGVYFWSQAYNEIETLKEKFEQYQRAKSSRPSSYGEFHGGGRGIGGGLSGAIKASLLNLAVDAVAGAANQVVDHKRLESIGKELNDMYNKIVKDNLYLVLFEADCNAIRNLVLNLLIEEGFLPNIEGYNVNISNVTLKEIITNSKIDAAHYDKSISDMGELIQKKPYEPILYAALCEINPKLEDEILDFVSKNKMKDAFLTIKNPEYSKPATENAFKFTLD